MSEEKKVSYFEPAVEGSQSPETVTPAAPEKRKRGRPKGSKNSSSKPAVPREAKPRGRPATRSLLLKDLPWEEKRKMIVSPLVQIVGKDLSFVEEDKYSFAEINLNGHSLFVRVNKREGKRFGMFLYNRDFRGKKVKPISRCYERRGRAYVSRFMDRVNQYLSAEKKD